MQNLPKKLTENRAIIEGNLIGCLWKEPDLYYDFNEINVNEDFMTEDGKFYYSLGLNMYKLGYKVFDETSVYTYLKDKSVIKNGFDNRGGYTQIKELIEIINIANVDIIYDEFMKYNVLARLHKQGFEVIDNLEKFKKMNSQQVYDFFDYHLNNAFIKKASGNIQISDITSDYDKYFDEWNDGANVGIKIGFPMLNYHFAGIHKKNMILHCAKSGEGKSSSSILFYILPAIKQGEKVVVIANEQDESSWRQMIVSSVISNELRNWGFNRQKLTYGGFTEKDWQALNQAKDWLANYKGCIEFAHITDYGIKNIKKIIKKYSKLGYGLFIFDTMKPVNEADSKAWAVFTENSKELFQTAHKEDVALICTVQLSQATSSRKFLDSSCIAKSKAIAEVAGQIIMFRSVHNNEKANLKAFNYERDKSGKYTKNKTYIDLKENEDYAIFFIDKNRYGRDNIQLIYRKNLDFNVWEELGYVAIDYDGF